MNHIETTRLSGTSRQQFVHESGKGGELMGLAVAGGIGYHYVAVTLDGHRLVDNYLSGIRGGPSHGNNGLTVGLPFKRDLVIEIRNGVDSPLTVFWASYRLDGPPVEEHSAMLRTVIIEDVPHAMRVSGDSQVLLGPTLFSRVVLDDDVWLPGNRVTGRVELVSSFDWPVDEGPESLSALEILTTAQHERLSRERLSLGLRFVGKSRFFPLRDLAPQPTQSFAVSIEELFEELTFYESPRTSAFFALRAPYGLELIARIPGFASIPSDPF